MVEGLDIVSAIGRCQRRRARTAAQAGRHEDSEDRTGVLTRRPGTVVVVVGAGFARAERREDARQPRRTSGRPRRSSQPSSFPAAALPGGNRRAQSIRHRRAHSRAVPARAERRGSSRARRAASISTRQTVFDERPRASVRLPDPCVRRAAQLFRPSRMGGVRARAQDARAGDRDSAAYARRVRARGKRARSLKRQRAYLTFVVVGGGPTGVELAGAIADISRTAMRGDFRRIDPAKSHIVLVEAAPARADDVLGGVVRARAPRSRGDWRRSADQRQGRSDRRAKASRSDPGKLAARTVFWAAGVQAERLTIVAGARNRPRRAHQSEHRFLGARAILTFSSSATWRRSRWRRERLLPGVAPGRDPGWRARRRA